MFTNEKGENVFSKSELLQEKGLREPATKAILVTVKVQKLSIKDSTFYLMEGNYTGSSRLFSSTFSVEKGNILKLNDLCDDKTRTLKLKLELFVAGITGYIKDDVACAHKSDGWKVSGILQEITELSPEDTHLSIFNRAIELFSLTHNGRTEPESAQDIADFNKYLGFA